MALELKDLTDEERLALVALLDLLVKADTYASDAEATQVDTIIAAIGEERYQAAVEEADRRFEDSEALRRFIPTVGRQEAREVIYETLLEAALADTPLNPEREVLDWLAGVWDVQTRIVDPASES